ncbi:MAG: PQQ-binding-like beta-propeller repeat protein [Planctomycetota bacterium]
MSQHAAFLATFLAATLAFSSNQTFAVEPSDSQWAHWRGPTGNGTSTTASPPVKWSSNENVKWKVAIPGSSSGSPVIWNDNVFVVTAVANGRTSGRQLPLLDFKLFCFDRNDGSLKWERTAVTMRPVGGTHSTNNFAPASPCTDGELVFAHFGSQGLYCFTIAGEPVWSRKDLGKMVTRGTFGEGSSPTIAGDKLIVPWDHEGPSSLFALDKRTGKTIWQVDRDEPSCWATPLIIETDSGKQIVMNGQNYARSYDLETGKELWRCAGQTQRPVATPVFDGERVVVGSGFRGAFMAAFLPDGNGNIQGSRNVVWAINRDTPDIASLLLSENRLYFHKAKTGILTCLDVATGKPFYQAQRLPSIRTTYASPIAAGGYVYLTGRSGTTVVIKDSEKLEVVAINSVGETVDTTPAPVDDELFIRGERHLFCITN